MKLISLWLLMSLFVYQYLAQDLIVDYDKILSDENEKFLLERKKLTIAQWKLESNITDHNEQIMNEVQLSFDRFRKQQYETIKKYIDPNETKKMNDFQKRQFEKLSFMGFSILDEKDGLEFKNVQNQMEKIYSSAKIDVGNRKNLSLEPELNQILRTSTDEKLLKEVWVKYRDATGKKMRQDFITYCKLGNKAARIHGKGFQTIDDIWMFDWESNDMKQEFERLVNDLMDLYKKIHAYVRFHLSKVYKDVMPKDGTIPAHLLGNMWAQTWAQTLTLVPEMQLNAEIPSLDKTINERLKNYSVRQMFEMSENFFTSLGMKNMTDKFWKNSIIEKPKNVEMVCHASAWDFWEKDDFRIKQCTVKTLEDLVTIHHEMGHIQYYMNYEKQPPVFRDGANPGFHEAIGDLMALSVVTPEHLAKIGLLNKEEIEKNLEAINLNYQLRMALDKIAFLPFSFVVDKWRWDVFADDNLHQHLNKHWWKLRIQYQGVSPPVKRSEEDFDPGSKYHVPSGTEYIRYFASHILQFQFYKHLCKYVPGLDKLYQCDFYANRQAGQDLIAMLEKGSADKWQNILNDFIGTSKMSLDALYEYFEPLNKTLTDFIDKNQIKLGWNAKVEDYFIEGKTSAADKMNSMTNIITILLLLFICLILN